MNNATMVVLVHLLQPHGLFLVQDATSMLGAIFVKQLHWTPFHLQFSPHHSLPPLSPPIPICPGTRGLSPDGRTRLGSSHWLKLIGGHFGEGSPSLWRLFAGSFCRHWHMPSRCIMAHCIMGKLMAQSPCVGGAWQNTEYLLSRGLGY